MDDDSLTLKNEQSSEINTPKENEKTKSPKVKIKHSSPKGSKDAESLKKNFGLIDDDIKKLNDDTELKNDFMRKVSMPIDMKKNEGHNSGNLRDSNRPKKRDIKIKKKDGLNKKFMRKNAKKAISPKKRRGGAEGGGPQKIRVVGKVSAKLSALIQRLGQNSEQTVSTSNKQFGDKVVMAPKIKAALEKFNRG